MKCFSRLVSHSALALLRNYVSLRTDMDILADLEKGQLELMDLLEEKQILVYFLQLVHLETRLCQGTDVSITAPDIGLFIPVRKQPPEGAAESFRPFKCIVLLPIPLVKTRLQ